MCVFIYIHMYTYTYTYTHICCVCIHVDISDVDECMDGTHLCDVNSNCKNMDPEELSSADPYTCECLIGYSGDGFICTGQ